MPVEMAIWRMTESGPVSLSASKLDSEQRLEDLVVKNPRLVGLDVLVLGRQVSTGSGGVVDVLGLDAEGVVHVLELKRDRTPRDVVAQTLDYGAWARDLSADDLESICADNAGATNGGADLEAAFIDRFGTSPPDVLNAAQQMTIIASELDPTSERIVEYLAESYAVPINAVFFRHFVDGDAEYLARTWLLPPEGNIGRRGKVRPWNGRDFYVVLGNLASGGHRWEIARRYGYLNAGGGSWFWKPLRNLTPGKRVFAYVGGAGYVGVGTVAGEMVRMRDATVEVDGEERPLIEQPEITDDLRSGALSDDPDKTEYVVPVEWRQIRSVDDAITETGLFASQVTVCKLRDTHTIEVLERAFDLQADDE